jgi:hypothetical protein
MKSCAPSDPRLAVVQFLERSCSNLVAIIGLDLEILPERIFEAPLVLSEHIEPFDASEESLL